MLLLSPTMIDDLESCLKTVVATGQQTLATEMSVQVSTYTSKQAAARKGKDLVDVEGQSPAEPASTGPAPSTPSLTRRPPAMWLATAAGMPFHTLNLNHK